MRKLVALLGAILLTLGAQGQPADPAFWQGQSIYQIITDRFYDGETNNNNADGNYRPRTSRGAHGGDFRGIEEKLDYVKALGATAIWISPVVQNAHGEYHGYAGRNFLEVDPRWGTLEDLKRMVAAAHYRGLLVIDDIVVNHGGDLIDSGDAGYGAFVAPPGGYHLRYRNPTNTYPAPFDMKAANGELTNLFHNNGWINDYVKPQQVMLGELSGLDDFRTESPYVREQMERIYESWIEQVGFDGFRIDTVKHVEPGFWQEWCPRVRMVAAVNKRPSFFMFGEVLDGSDALCGSFTGKEGGGAFELDSVLDYPLYFKVQDVFARGKASPHEIEKRYAGLDKYDVMARERLVTFLDNHDQPRFLNRTPDGNDIDRLRVALVFLYTARGVPCLYYATEQGFNGGTDPNDREDMFAGPFKDKGSAGKDSFDMTSPLFRLVAELNNFRRTYPELRLGEHVDVWAETNGPGLLVYKRRLGTNEAVVALNTAEEEQRMAFPGEGRINLFDTNESAGSVLVLPAWSAKIFVARGEWRALDPVVESIEPGHDATNAPVGKRIVVTFSDVMETKTVQRGFSIEPTVAGSFSWRGKSLSFTPEGKGLAPGTMYHLRIEEGARAVSGRALHGAFEMRFRPAGTP